MPKLVLDTWLVIVVVQDLAFTDWRSFVRVVNTWKPSVRVRRLCKVWWMKRIWRPCEYGDGWKARVLVLGLDRIPLLPLLPLVTIYQGVDICSTVIVVVVVVTVVRSSM